MVGFALFVGLIVREGIGEVAAAIAGAGWGVLAVAAFHVVPLAADSAAWRALVRRPHRPPLPGAMFIRWIGESVNSLLPAAQIGGELARVRMAMLQGVPGAQAGATVTVDVTIGTLTQIALALTALAMLARLGGHDNGDLVTGVFFGLGVLAVLVGIFAVVQNAGLFRTLARLLVRLVGSDRFALVGGARALDREISGIYRHRRLLVSLAWRVTGWLVGAGEVWLALHFLGRPVGPAEAFMLEILGHGARSIVFFIPAGLGIQEGAFVLLGTALGLPPSTALAVSLLKRIRELTFGMPGLAAWQFVEGRRLLRRSRAEPRVRS